MKCNNYMKQFWVLCFQKNLFDFYCPLYSYAYYSKNNKHYLLFLCNIIIKGHNTFIYQEND